ncbi:hypothetical protein C2E21_4617 [Chlorella sorokiniana]|uniref:Uncharacterized protein n=1 Tax=Chlorella sorokiniana TaxID=3076 RepID=A0A2P6TQV7_CHLSO|nr:hypothetical protein C2E21_4617 [Chlorella sorokiniana]|eukprot:PRW56452.1 hypothetical protein C2E21_4617 [Chlorella sorokiniana]
MAGANLEPVEGDDIVAAAFKVLCTADPHEKARRTNAIVEMWQDGRIGLPQAGAAHPPPPDRPARESTKVKLVPADKAPKRGKGGSLASRQAMLHALVHIENAAVDLAWDIIARFGLDPTYQLPREFYDDFVTVAEDECRHFLLLEQRLQAVGSHYGALTAHDGLWESAAETAHSLPARLAVEHCTHEARGLDVLPQTIHRFRSNGDGESADLLQNVIYKEEVSHCAAGVRWLKHLHALARGMGQAAGAPAAEAESRAIDPAGQQAQQAQQAQQEAAPAAAVPAASGPPAAIGQQEGQLPAWAEEARRHATVEEWFHALVRAHFWGPLKPPFNEEARAAAGFGPEWYLPLSADVMDAAEAAKAAAKTAAGGAPVADAAAANATA